MTDLLRVETNERMDLEDFEFLAASLGQSEQEKLANFDTNPAGQRMWILNGFGATNPAGKQLTITRGRAILAYRDEGIVKYGAFSIGGDATKTVDLTAYASATYGIYVRFEYVDSESRSRIFWNPSGDGSEFAQTIATRRAANWSMRVEASNPGAEWLQIGTVVQSTMVITDMRPFLFEGEANNSYRSGWSTDGGGASTDRNANRALYGVSDLQKFTAAMRQCLQDIKGRGLREWYSRDIGGMNIGFDAAPVEDALAVGDQNFNLYNNGGYRYLNFDDDHGIYCQLSANTISVKADGGVVAQFYAEGVRIANGLNVGFMADDPVTDTIAIGDVDFYLQLNSGIASLNFASSDYMQYDRAANSLSFLIGSALAFKSLATGFWAYPATFLKNLAGPANKSNWKWAVETAEGELELFTVDDAGGTPVLQHHWEKDGSGVVEWVSFEGGAAGVGMGLDLHHSGGVGSFNRWQFQAFNDILKFNLRNSTGSSTTNVCELRHAASGAKGNYWMESDCAFGHTAARWMIYGATVDTTVLKTGTGASAGVECDLEPFANSSSYNLGGATKAWYRAYLDRISLGEGAGEGFVSNLYPDASASNRSIGSATRKWYDAQLSHKLWLTPDTVIDVNFVLGAADTAYAWNWRATSDNLYLDLLNASYAYQNWLIRFIRNGTAPVGIEVQGRGTFDVDSGYSGTKNATLVSTGIDPIVKFENQHTGLDADNRNWYLMNERVAAQGHFSFRSANAGYTSDYEWLAAQARGGSSGNEWLVDYVSLKAEVAILFDTPLVKPGDTVGGSDLGDDTYFWGYLFSMGPRAKVSTAVGATGWVTYTGNAFPGNSGVAYTVKGTDGTLARDSAGFLKIFVGTTIYYIPYFAAYNGS